MKEDQTSVTQSVGGNKSNRKVLGRCRPPKGERERFGDTGQLISGAIANLVALLRPLSMKVNATCIEDARDLLLEELVNNPRRTPCSIEVILPGRKKASRVRIRSQGHPKSPPAPFSCTIRADVLAHTSSLICSF